MLNKDYKEMLQRLLEEKAEFIIVGAYALAAGFLQFLAKGFPNLLTF